MLLRKGIEEEGYTGTLNGDIVGLSHLIAADLPGFHTEPDSRNTEYATAPILEYEHLACALSGFRGRLREYLKNSGGYEIIPGASMSVGDSRTFHRSDPKNPYHDYIEQTYGTRVVTASEHINIGIEDPEDLIRVYRLIRSEASIFLALSAASPFLDGEFTGFHSIRWNQFPHTPKRVPLFHDHAHYIAWVEEQLELNTMQNIRHVWSSARPNGFGAPYEIQRMELRVCDRIEELDLLLAVIALVEARCHQALDDDSLDPLKTDFKPDTLVDWISANEAAVARNSLDAEIVDWRTGEKIFARDAARRMIDEVHPYAHAGGFCGYLAPLDEVLEKGNMAQRWIAKHEAGMSVREIVKEAILQAYDQDRGFKEAMPDCDEPEAKGL